MRSDDLASTPEPLALKLRHTKTRRWHVVYLIDTLYSLAAGAEATVLKLCKHLPADRYRCSVATFGIVPQAADYFCCPVHFFPLHRTYDWTAVRTAFTLRRWLRQEGVDILHTFFPSSDIWGGIVGRISGCPVLISGRRDMGFLRQRKHRVAYRILNRMFDQVQAVSDMVRDFHIAEDHLDPAKVVTVYNGIDLQLVDSIEPLRDSAVSRELEGASHVVITVANLRPIKGIDVLIRAAVLVRREFPRAKFVVVGQPFPKAYLGELQQLAASLGVEDGVRFLGQRNDVIALLKIADVFCLPSHSEGMSNALLEAMACSLPCVATDVGGNGEVVNDRLGGYLVAPGQPQALAARIMDLLKNRDQARRMGAFGRQMVESKFTVQRMVDRVVGLYEGLLETHAMAGSKLS